MAMASGRLNPPREASSTGYPAAGYNCFRAAVQASEKLERDDRRPLMGGISRWMVATALVSFLTLGGGPAARAGGDPAVVIGAALQQWRVDFNERQGAHICDLFAPSLIYDFQGLPEQNYALLCARLHRALADPARSFRYGLRIKEILVSGSLAVVRLTWISTVTTPGGDSTTTDEPGLDVFQRQADGAWKIIRYIAYEENEG
jgi:ketosteroid isomerase-like protein